MGCVRCSEPTKASRTCPCASCAERHEAEDPRRWGAVCLSPFATWPLPEPGGGRPGVAATLEEAAVAVEERRLSAEDRRWLERKTDDLREARTRPDRCAHAPPGLGRLVDFTGHVDCGSDEARLAGDPQFVDEAVRDRIGRDRATAPREAPSRVPLVPGGTPPDRVSYVLPAGRGKPSPVAPPPVEDVCANCTCCECTCQERPPPFEGDPWALWTTEEQDNLLDPRARPRERDFPVMPLPAPPVQGRLASLDVRATGGRPAGARRARADGPDLMPPDVEARGASVAPPAEGSTRQGDPQVPAAAGVPAGTAVPSATAPTSGKIPSPVPTLPAPAKPRAGVAARTPARPGRRDGLLR
jgi:hypothetical protein